MTPNQFTTTGWIEETLFLLEDVCCGKCSISSISASPNGPGMANTIVTNGYMCTYVRASNDIQPTPTHESSFDLGPCFDPPTRTLLLSESTYIGLRFPSNDFAKVTAWEIIPTGTIVTAPSRGSHSQTVHKLGQSYRAIYERLAYRVAMHSNYPEDSIISEFVVKSNAYAPALNPLPTRPGYTFSGTTDSPEHGTGQAYHDKTGRTIQRWTREDDGDIFCHWDPNTYRIDYAVDDIAPDDSLRRTYKTGEEFALPTPSRYGYLFDGWEVSGAQGAGVETVTEADGTKTTHVKAGTYGDLTCTAKWVLRYDLDVPVVDPGKVTFEVDSLTGQVRVKPGTSAEGAILSYMAVPVTLDSLLCEGLEPDGSPDLSGGASGLEAVFGPGSATKVRFTATIGDGDSAQMVKLAAGSSVLLSSFPIPAAASKENPGRISISYGLELNSSLVIPPVRDAMPVARLAYTVTLPNESLQIEHAEHMN